MNEDSQPWIVSHATDHPGHETYESLVTPPKCLTCGAKSPIYEASA